MLALERPCFLPQSSTQPLRYESKIHILASLIASPQKSLAMLRLRGSGGRSEGDYRADVRTLREPAIPARRRAPYDPRSTRFLPAANPHPYPPQGSGRPACIRPSWDPSPTNQQPSLPISRMRSAAIVFIVSGANQGFMIALP
jgi:hypothetical protein